MYRIHESGSGLVSGIVLGLGLGLDLGLGGFVKQFENVGSFLRKILRKNEFKFPFYYRKMTFLHQKCIL